MPRGAQREFRRSNTARCWWDFVVDPGRGDRVPGRSTEPCEGVARSLDAWPAGQGTRPQPPLAARTGPGPLVHIGRKLAPAHGSAVLLRGIAARARRLDQLPPDCG